MTSMFTEIMKQRRMELGYTIRKFAVAKGLDAGYLSRLENGLIQPPADRDKVENLARALEFKEGSKEWSDFIDAVAIARAEVPMDLRANENLMKVLPAFYRSVRKEKFDEVDVEELINLIEESRKVE